MSSASRRPSIASDSAYSLGLRVCLYFTGFCASILISRVLGPAGRGVYYLPVITAGTLASFGTLGLEQANIVLFGNNRVAVERLWAQSGLVAAVAGVGGFALTVAAPLVLPHLYAQTPVLLLVLAGSTIPFALHTVFAASLLSLRGQVTWQFRAGFVGAVVHLALLAALVATRQLSVATVQAAMLVSVVTTWLLIARRAAPGGAWIAWDPSLMKETVRHSLPLHLATILLFLHLRLDMFMVSGLLGAAALGIYSLAVTLAETVQLATESLSVSLLPRQVGNSLDEASQLSLRGARANAIVGLVLALGWAVLGLPIIRFAFGRAFAATYLPLLMLLPGIVCLGMQRACAGAVLRSGHPWRIAGVQAASLAFNATLNTFLIPALGTPGAALASLVSYGSSTVVFLVWTSRLAGVSVADGALPGRADARLLRQSAGRLISSLGGTLDARV